MKNLLTVLFITLLSFSAGALDDISHGDGQKTVYITKDNSDTDDDRNPGPQSIICHYSSESITLNFPADVECITISIGPEYAPIWTGTVTAEQPTAQLSAITGEHRVSCHTDTDVLYTGFLTF